MPFRFAPRCQNTREKNVITKIIVCQNTFFIKLWTFMKYLKIKSSRRKNGIWRLTYSKTEVHWYRKLLSRPKGSIKQKCRTHQAYIYVCGAHPMRPSRTDRLLLRLLFTSKASCSANSVSRLINSAIMNCS